MEHPVADYAKDVMQAAVAGTGVHLSDGSTNILPVGSDEQIQAAWRLHHRLVRRSLERAIYQGWDLHPAQLPTRFIANIAFYREGFDRAASRLHAYLTKSGGGILDEPATARALARYLYRGFACGAVTDAELIGAVGLDAGPAGAARPPEVRHRERGGPAPIVTPLRRPPTNCTTHETQGSDLVSSTTSVPPADLESRRQAATTPRTAATRRRPICSPTARCSPRRTPSSRAG